MNSPQSFTERMQAALDRITSASDPDAREEAEAAMAQLIRSVNQRRAQFDHKQAQTGERE